MEPPLVAPALALLVNAVPGRVLDPLEAVTPEEDGDDLVDGGVLGDQEALVLGTGHQDAVVDADQTALPHLEGELALAPGVTGLELGGPGTKKGERSLVSILNTRNSLRIIFHKMLKADKRPSRVPGFEHPFKKSRARKLEKDRALRKMPIFLSPPIFSPELPISRHSLPVFYSMIV